MLRKAKLCIFDIHIGLPVVLLEFMCKCIEVLCVRSQSRRIFVFVSCDESYHFIKLVLTAAK